MNLLSEYLLQIFPPSLWLVFTVLLTHYFLQKYSSLTKIVCVLLYISFHYSVKSTNNCLAFYYISSAQYGAGYFLDDKYLLIEWITTVNILVCFILNENGIKLIYVLPSSYLKLQFQNFIIYLQN